MGIQVKAHYIHLHSFAEGVGRARMKAETGERQEERKSTGDKDLGQKIVFEKYLFSKQSGSLRMNIMHAIQEASEGLEMQLNRNETSKKKDYCPSIHWVIATCSFVVDKNY